jgi:acetyl esterase/lipase
MEQNAVKQDNTILIGVDDHHRRGTRIANHLPRRQFGDVAIPGGALNAVAARPKGVRRRQSARIGCLAVTLGFSVAVASGYGCPSAWADPSTPFSSGAWTLLDFAPSEFGQILGEASPTMTASAGANIDELAMATQAASSDTANPWSALLTLLDGVSPPPSTPGVEVGFSGQPSLLMGLGVAALDIAKPFENLFGIDLMSFPVPESVSSPSWLTSLDGLTVTETEFDGMPVCELTPPDPSGQYVVAIHGGAYVDQPTIFHWLAYTDMAHQTDATIIVPIYPLAPEGTAATVEPQIADLISSEIATEGASHVSVYGDSAGGGITLAAVELLVNEGQPVPESMVLDSPSLDLSLSNPNISLVNDPILNLADAQHDELLWAGNLPLTDPLVSPLYGSLQGLPPTDVYSGSDDILAPDVLRLQTEAIALGAPISFILRAGEIHDWALLPFLDGAQVQQQIYQELGLTDASTSAATANPDIVDALHDRLQNLSAEFSFNTLVSGFNLGDLSTDAANVLTTMSTEVSGLWGELSAMVGGALASF